MGRFQTRGIALLAVACGLMAAPQAARAQQSLDNRLLFDERGVQVERPAPVPPQQTPARRNAAPNVGAAPPADARTTSRARAKDSATPEQRFGRVPIDNFSVGLETDKKLKTDELPGGGKIPAIESMRKDQISPVVGFSLSVPNSVFSGSKPQQ